jgi:hypothetical protein
VEQLLPDHRRQLLLNMEFLLLQKILNQLEILQHLRHQQQIEKQYHRRHHRQQLQDNLLKLHQ